MTNFLLQPLGTVSQQWDVGDDDHNLFWFIFFCDTSYLSFLLYDLSFICFNLLFKTWYSGLIYVTLFVQSYLIIFRKRNRHLFYQIENYHIWQYTSFNSGFIPHCETRNQICYFAIKKNYKIKVISLMDVLKHLIAWWLILYGHKKIGF